MWKRNRKPVSRHDTTDKTRAVTVEAMTGSREAELEPEPEPETGHLLLDMTSSTIETRRRQRRRQHDDTSSDADRETALIAHVNSDEVAQMSSDSCQNSKWRTWRTMGEGTWSFTKLIRTSDIIGVRDGGQRGEAPSPQKKIRRKYFSGKYRIKFGHFVQF